MSTYWASKSTLPYNFYSSLAIVYNNKIHILGGGSPNTDPESRKKHYSWDGESWIEESTLPYNFISGCVVVYNNEIHILGGTDSTSSHYAWNGTSWSVKTSLPVDASSAVIYNNRIHILGGANSKKTHYSWNGTNQWVEESTLPYEFNGGSAVVYNNKIHILGGQDDNTKHYSWDGTSWSQESSSLPYTYYFGRAVVYDNKIHIMGGNHNLTQHYSWNGTIWSKESTLPYNFYNGGATVYDDQIHILGSYYDKTKHYAWGEITPDPPVPPTPTVDGIKVLDLRGTAFVANKVNEKLKAVTTIPSNPTNEMTVLYIGTTTGTYTKGHTYQYNGSSWNDISPAGGGGDMAKVDYDNDNSVLNAGGINPFVTSEISSAMATLAEVAFSNSYNDLDDQPTIPDITGKADKVSNATDGNFAGLDANGNLIDSGKKPSDFLTQHQDISGKADKVITATENNFAGFDSNGNLKDSGKNADSFLTSTNLPTIEGTAIVFNL